MQVTKMNSNKWSLRKLNDICDVRDGTHDSPNYVKNGVKFVTSKNIVNGKVNFSDISYISEEDAKEVNKRSKVDKGDILFSMIGTIGSCAIVDSDPDFCIKNVALIKPKKEVIPDYLYHYLSSKQFLERVLNSLDGGIQKFISLGNLRSIEVSLPQTEEQKKLADVCNDISKLIEQQEKLISKKRDIKQATMQQLLTGKTRLPGFSGEWEEKKLGDCLRSRPKYGINAAASPQSDSLPMYLRITDITEDGTFSKSGRASVNSSNSSEYFLEENDLVFARTGASVGKSYLYQPADGRLVYAGFLIRVQPDPKTLIPYFLSMFTKSAQYNTWVKVMSMRSGQPGINGNEYAQLPIPLPPIDEQRAISDIIFEMDADISANHLKLEKLKLLKQGMMQELLTGRIRLV